MEPDRSELTSDASATGVSVCFVARRLFRRTTEISGIDFLVATVPGRKSAETSRSNPGGSPDKCDMFWRRSRLLVHGSCLVTAKNPVPKGT